MNQLCYNFHSIFCYASTLLLHYYWTAVFSLCFATNILLTHGEPVASAEELLLRSWQQHPSFYLEMEADIARCSIYRSIDLISVWRRRSDGREQNGINWCQLQLWERKCSKTWNWYGTKGTREKWVHREGTMKCSGDIFSHYWLQLTLAVGARPCFEYILVT